MIEAARRTGLADFKLSLSRGGANKSVASLQFKCELAPPSSQRQEKRRFPDVGANSIIIMNDVPEILDFRRGTQFSSSAALRRANKLPSPPPPPPTRLHTRVATLARTPLRARDKSELDYATLRRHELRWEAPSDSFRSARFVWPAFCSRARALAIASVKMQISRRRVSQQVASGARRRYLARAISTCAGRAPV